MSANLTVRGVTYAYPGRNSHTSLVLNDVSFMAAPGERVAIVGRSGAGKSTLLRIMLALLSPSAGAVELDGKPVFAGSQRTTRWYRQAVQYVPQDPAVSLDPRMSAGRLIAEPLRRLGALPSTDTGSRRAQRHAERERVIWALRAVGLDEGFLTARRGELSGGQAQRVAIARAIATRPRFLLADEPVSGLDVPLRDTVLTLLQDLATTHGMGIVFVSHDLNAVYRLCERAVVLDGGRVVEDTDVASLCHAPQSAEGQRLAAALPQMPVVGGVEVAR